MTRAIPAEIYWAKRNELERAGVDLQEAEADLAGAIKERDLWKRRADNAAAAYPDAVLDYVRAFSLAASIESRRNAAREKVGGLSWELERVQPREQDKAPAEQEPEAKPKQGPPKPKQEALPPPTPIERMRAEIRRNKTPKRKLRAPGKRPCALEGCTRRAAANGRCASHKKTRQARADGQCAYGCGRSTRYARSGCAPCTEAGALVGVCSCSNCGSPARGLGGLCGRHDKHLRVAA